MPYDGEADGHPGCGIEIVGTQRLNGDSDKIELTTVGTLQTEPETLVFRYTEQQEPPEEPVYVQVRLRRDQTEAEILRTGAYGSCLTIARGQRNLCRYGTPYGDVLMGIYGKAVEIQENAADGRCSCVMKLTLTALWPLKIN